jgi:hypothetical protein
MSSAKRKKIKQIETFNSHIFFLHAMCISKATAVNNCASETVNYEECIFWNTKSSSFTFFKVRKMLNPVIKNAF